MAAAAYKTEHVAATPRGWKVRSVKRGSHVIRIGVPPGRRKKGAGKVVEILHPKSEQNPSCIVSHTAKANPAELLVFTNPSTAEKKRATRERASRIRSARLNAQPGWAVLEKGRELKYSSYVSWPTKAQAEKSLREVEAAYPDRKFRIVKVKGNPKKMRGNPTEQEEAVRLFKDFHGRDPEEIVEEHISAAMRLDYTALGPLIAIGIGEPRQTVKQLVTNWQKENHIGFSNADAVMVASAPNRKQLYLIGGNQNVLPCLAKFEVDTTKDFIDLGDIGFIVYFARKATDNFEPAEYMHRFGEETKVVPRGMYDKLRKQIFFTGGAYHVTEKGIEN